ncbi:hypothetical protein KAK06_14780 [Ideonella sp. 4Y11]|uniref:Uncharacterized protein n=1 Tax=Ideonella aquatica TaxID=2824119 RepID=A0A940YNN6_9BURK|nr:hypothetical protein [Ideonella aquatica]MBQ0960217.1 hypothetical protein [Ideonella aquatica]
MLEPEIYWHYFGKLRAELEDAACEQATRSLQAALTSEVQARSCFVIPATSEGVLFEAIIRWLRATSMKVYATTLDGLVERRLSTVYRQEDADFALTCYVGALGALADKLQPNTLLRRIFSGGGNGRSSNLLVVSLMHQLDRPADTSAHSRMCHDMAKCAERRGYRTVILPEPGMRLDALLHFVRTAPSRILDGSHKSERELERRLADVSDSPSIGPLLAVAWRHLKSGTDPGLLVRREFDRRVREVGEAAQIYPWEAIISLWSAVLHGLESDEEYAGRWYSKVNARRDGWVPLDAINDMLLHEAAIYCLHARVDPACMSYLVVYHGSRWLQQRMALASFGGISPASARPVWE